MMDDCWPAGVEVPKSADDLAQPVQAHRGGVGPRERHFHALSDAVAQGATL